MYEKAMQLTEKERMEMVESRLYRIVDIKLREGSVRRQIKELEELRDELGGAPKAAVLPESGVRSHGIGDPTGKVGVKRGSYAEKIERLKDRLEEMVMERMTLEDMLSDMPLSPNAREYARLRYVEGRRVGYIIAQMDLSASTCRRLRLEVLSGKAFLL